MAGAQQREVGIAEDRLRTGGIARVDVQRQRAELAQTQALIPGLTQQIEATRHQLAVYTGQTPAAAQLPEFRLEDLRLPDTLPLSLPSTLARRRPDIRAAEALLHQASANIGVATANLYPQITLSASGGWQSTTARNLFDSFNVWSLAAGLVQPVFHGGELLARKRAAEAAYEQSLAAYRQAVLQGLQNVADALRALESDAATLRARADNARQARDTLGIVSEQYRLGAVSASSRCSTPSASRARLRWTWRRRPRTGLADSAALLQALGGGWWEEEAQTSAAAPAMQ
ncbi:efflux transporter outer membrane subunit [Cupriavidus basilensis]